MKTPEWKKFQDYIAMKLHPIDPNARSTKGSGNCGEVGDVQNRYLVIECKDESKKNVFSEKYMQKIIEECPVHSARIPVLFTRNQDGKMRVHMDADMFLDLFVEKIQNEENT